MRGKEEGHSEEVIYDTAREEMRESGRTGVRCM